MGISQSCFTAPTMNLHSVAEPRGFLTGTLPLCVVLMPCRASNQKTLCLKSSLWRQLCVFMKFTDMWKKSKKSWYLQRFTQQQRTWENRPPTPSEYSLFLKSAALHRFLLSGKNVTKIKGPQLEVSTWKSVKEGIPSVASRVIFLGFEVINNHFFYAFCPLQKTYEWWINHHHGGKWFSFMFLMLVPDGCASHVHDTREAARMSIPLRGSNALTCSPVLKLPWVITVSHEKKGKKNTHKEKPYEGQWNHYFFYHKVFFKWAYCAKEVTVTHLKNKYI